jgi:hypothetical protein
MTASVQWDDPPGKVRAAIEEQTGPVQGTSPGGEGASSSLRLVLHASDRDIFAKGVGPTDDSSRQWRLNLGAELSPYVTPIAPALLWQVREEGWNVTGYEYLPGRPWASHKPGSPDLPAMLAVLQSLNSIPAPQPLTVTAADCWADYADHPGILDGDALVHRDPNPTNFVISGNRAWLVDWGWAVRGPAWITSAQLILSMMEAGWEAPRAEEALETVPAWKTAPPRAVTGFADANARSWDAAVARAPGDIRRFRAGIAREWASHRADLART